ncbi:unnamed protein product [Mesocestoides corti]|uniref:Hydroxyacyl-coenzyme A dehydrogenase, mitochondrial n=1 Tax=Mesocestoides corti TaxID=53468 RepID=A0A0R3UQY5_MESCO|nr:unnamed protein product [Mesocestoides corti]
MANHLSRLQMFVCGNLIISSCSTFFGITRFISNVTVIGCGTMGSGIAAVSANAGYSVNLVGKKDSSLSKSEELIVKSIQRLANDNLDNCVASAMSRIEFTTDLKSAVSDSDIVIESITENMSSKRKLFESIDQLAPRSCVFASNTSSLSIGELAGAISRKELFGGLHFFNPVQTMKLVEVIKSEYTSKGTVKILTSFAESVGKVVVHCKDTPGFIVNRLLVPYLIEAIEMWERGDASIADIDTAMRLGAGYPMGPFELADYVGLDTLLSIISGWVERYPSEHAFRLNATVKQFVTSRRFGRKCGHGFYKYDKRGRIVRDE